MSFEFSPLLLTICVYVYMGILTIEMSPMRIYQIRAICLFNPQLNLFLVKLCDITHEMYLKEEEEEYDEKETEAALSLT